MHIQGTQYYCSLFKTVNYFYRIDTSIRRTTTTTKKINYALQLLGKTRIFVTVIAAVVVAAAPKQSTGVPFDLNVRAIENEGLRRRTPVTTPYLV